MSSVAVSSSETSGYNDVSVDHVAAAGDNFAIVVTWQKQISVGGVPPTPGAPTYGGEAMDYVGTACLYGGGGINSTHEGVWVYIKHGILPGSQTVTFAPTAGYRGSLGVITGRWANPVAEDVDTIDNQSGGSFSFILTTTVGALVILAYCGDGGEWTGDGGTTAWYWSHDDGDNRWDGDFGCAYKIADATSEAWGGPYGGSNGLLAGSWPSLVVAGNQVIWFG